MTIVEFLQSNSSAFIITLTTLGLIVGSFLNVVIHRLPQMMENDWRQQCAELMGSECPDSSGAEKLSLSHPASHCPHCAHRLSVFENIPLFSYLVQKGQCRSCGQAIAWRYPFVELLGAVLAGCVAVHFGFGWPACLAAILSWALLTLAWIDFDTQYLPDAITLPLLWLGIGANLFGVFTDLQSSVVGAMIGYGSLWSVYQLFKLLTGKEGMGFGDFKLLGCLGAWLGWQVLPIIVMLSSVGGSVVGIAIICLRRSGRDLKIPFGPYLAIAGWIALLWGNDINQWYLQHIGISS